MSHRITFDVGGQVYKISTRAFENGPPSRLTRMYKCGTSASDSTYIEVDRPADLFASVLALYQTGELHFPTSSCPGAFLNELEFWDISPEVTEDCCFNRLQNFLEEQTTLKKFQKSRELQTEESNVTGQSLKNCMRKVWNIVDYSKPSIFARIYFAVSFSMVLLSIITVALSTDPYFRRKMTNCERLEFMEFSGMEKTELAKKWLKRNCESKTIPHHPPPGDRAPPDHEKACGAMARKLFQQVFLNRSDFDNEKDKHNQEREDFPFNKSAKENPHKPGALPGTDGEYVELPDFEIPVYACGVLEAVSVVYFTVDILLRLISCPSKKRYFLGVINATDALALICTYVHFILMYIYKHERYRDNWMDLLKYSQVLRSLRLFRIITNVRAGKVLAYTVRTNLRDLSVLVLFLIAGMSIFATCLFFAEEREDIRSIPVGWYWAIVSMTTVGYGDIAPKTVFGRFLACLCTIAGIILLSLTVPIFANNFLTLYQFADSERALKKFQMRKSMRQNSKTGVHLQHSGKNNNFSLGDVKSN